MAYLDGSQKYFPESHVKVVPYATLLVGATVSDPSLNHRILQRPGYTFGVSITSSTTVPLGAVFVTIKAMTNQFFKDGERIDALLHRS